MAHLTHVSEMQKKIETLSRITTILKDVIQNKVIYLIALLAFLLEYAEVSWTVIEVAVSFMRYLLVEIVVVFFLWLLKLLWYLDSMKSKLLNRTLQIGKIL